jgi:hypothetical protein
VVHFGVVPSRRASECSHVPPLRMARPDAHRRPYPLRATLSDRLAGRNLSTLAHRREPR